MAYQNKIKNFAYDSNRNMEIYNYISAVIKSIGIIDYLYLLTNLRIFDRKKKLYNVDRFSVRLINLKRSEPNSYLLCEQLKPHF